MYIDHHAALPPTSSYLLHPTYLLVHLTGPRSYILHLTTSYSLLHPTTSSYILHLTSYSPLLLHHRYNYGDKAKIEAMILKSDGDEKSKAQQRAQLRGMISYAENE